jgi:dihydroorotate dehydrogenase
MNIIDSIAKNALFRLDPEVAHGFSIRGLKLFQATGIALGGSNNQYPDLVVNLAGLNFPNPLGIAAGFDKNGEVPRALLGMGFGFAEIGTVTPLPQNGNPRPRVFRLPSEQAVINRLGFNNQGHSNVVNNLQSIRLKNSNDEIIGVNIGANKDSADFIQDYELGLKKFWCLASYLTINISSPNTPGLRDLQSDNSLNELLGRVDSMRKELCSETDKSPPIFIKIAPDLSERAIEGIAGNIRMSSINGLIISNTTVSRSDLRSPNSEGGGLSGRPVFNRSTIVLAKMRALIGTDLPIIGVGGIDNAQSAWQKIEAGANLIQLYTGMIYQGPSIANRICRELSQKLKASEFSDIAAITASRNAEWAAKDLPE